jgi:hypothetical protein
MAGEGMFVLLQCVGIGRRAKGITGKQNQAAESL